MSIDRNTTNVQSMQCNDDISSGIRCEEYCKKNFDRRMDYYYKKYNACCNDSCREHIMRKIEKCREVYEAEYLRCLDRCCDRTPISPTGPTGPTGSTAT